MILEKQNPNKIKRIYRDEYWAISDDDENRFRYLGKAGENELYFEENCGRFGSDKPLLQLEVDAATRLKRWEPQVNKDVVLVLLIGGSFDPLLQTVWYYEPKKILPVLNTYYFTPNKNLGYSAPGGTGYESPEMIWDRFKPDLIRLPKRIVQKFEKDTWLESPFDGPVEDDPAKVFAFLHRKLGTVSTDEYQLIIDITGAKKSMIAGAYFYAAYRRAEISYVDFDIYDKEKGRPYGYTCKIGYQPNPFEEFSLQTWEQIEEFYREYNFSAATALLDDMNPDQFARLFVAFNPVKVEQEAQTVFTDLLTYLQVCEDWERGALKEAKDKHKILQSYIDIPTAVSKLGCYWTTISDSRIRFDFLTDEKAVIYYAEDELERARWHAKVPEKRQRDNDFQPDYRNAFSRAYALHETLLKSRVLLMFEHKKLHVGIPSPMINSGELTGQQIDDWQYWMVRSLESKQALSILKGQTGKKFERRLKVPDAQSKCLMNTVEHLGMDKKALKDLAIRRNEITHSYVHVPPELAQDAIKLAAKNLEHFRNVWLETCLDVPFELAEGPVVTAAPWEEVKKAFNLDFLISPRAKGKVQ